MYTYVCTNIKLNYISHSAPQQQNVQNSILNLHTNNTTSYIANGPLIKSRQICVLCFNIYVFRTSEELKNKSFNNRIIEMKLILSHNTCHNTIILTLSDVKLTFI